MQGRKNVDRNRKKYPTVEKEVLGAVWCVKRLYYFLMGMKIILCTDNKAVQLIFLGVSKRAETRLNSYALTLAYDIEYRYVKGEENWTDVMSRLCVGQIDSKTSRIDNEYEVKDLCVANIRAWEFQSLTLERIQKETAKDRELQAVMNAVKNHYPDETWKMWKNFLTRIYTTDGVLWFEEKLIVPNSLRQKALDIAHIGHPGERAMGRILRKSVWWPRVQEDILKCVKSCNGCTVVGRKSAPEPIMRTILPNGPWVKIAIDFCDVPSENLKIWTLEIH